MSGNDADAKDWVAQHLLKEWLGWPRLLDLGEITAAWATEMYLPLWLRLFGAVGTRRAQHQGSDRPVLIVRAGARGAGQVRPWRLST